MEFTEFENKLLDVDCFVYLEGNNISVHSFDYRKEVASISIEKVASFSFDFDLGYLYNYYSQYQSNLTIDVKVLANKRTEDIMNLVMEFVKTPLEERNIIYDNDDEF